MKYLESYFYTTAAAKQLIHDAQQKSCAHSYILHGADEISLLACARVFYSALLCRAEVTPCFECFGCRAALNGCADIAYFPSGERVLSIDAEEVRKSVMVMPMQFEYKIIQITRAHTMTEEAQNKLLKTLEEPNPNVIIVLLANSLNALLPTVVSRARCVRVQPLSAPQIASALEQNGASAQSAVLASQLCLGSLELAQQLNQDKNLNSPLDLVMEALLNIENSADILKYASLIGKRKDFPLLLNYLEIIFRDIMILRSGCKNVILEQRIDELYKLAQKYAKDAALRILDYIANIRSRLEVNCSQTALVDGLLFFITEVKYLCRE